MSEVEVTQVDQEEYPEMHRVLELALEAGRILLRNGAEIFRVEETIEHICKRFGVEAVDSFVLSNGIFFRQHTAKENENFAKVKHVPMAGIHLGIVTEVNDLSREISAGRVGIDEAFRRLEEIEKLPPKKMLVPRFGGWAWKRFFLLSAESEYMGELNCICHRDAFVCAGEFFAQKHTMSKIIINIVGRRIYYDTGTDCLEY